MRHHKLGLAALAGLTFAGCNFIVVHYDGYKASGGGGQGGTTTTASSSSSSGTAGGGGTGGTGGAPPAPGSTLWSKAFGGAGDDVANAVVVGPKDHVFITGSSANLAALGCTLPDAGATTGYLVELNPDGSCAWAFLFGGEGVGKAVAVDTKSIYLAGTFRSALAIDPDWTMSPSGSGVDSFIARFDLASHAFSWVRAFSDQATSVDQEVTALSTNGQGVAATVTYKESLKLSGPGIPDSILASNADDVDSIIVTFSNVGDLDEQVGVTSTSTMLAQTTGDVAFASDGAFAAIGTARGATRFNGVESSASNDENVFIAAYDATKTTLFTTIRGDTAVQWGRRIAFEPDGKLLVGGEFNGTIALGASTSLTNAGGFDVFLARYDRAGLISGAAAHLESSGGMTLGGLAAFADPGGYVIAAGGFSGSLQLPGIDPAAAIGGKDAWVARFEQGLAKAVWLRRFGDVEDQVVTSAAVDSLGNTIIVGRFQGSIDFDDSTSPYTAAVGDVFIAKLSP